MSDMPRPKPIEILAYHTSRCGGYVDLTAIVPVLNPITSTTVWGYARAIIRSVPLKGRILCWDEWRHNPHAGLSSLYPMWKRLGALPSFLWVQGGTS